MTALLLVLVTMVAFAAPAKAWWNDDWQLRKKITIDTSAAGANITDPIGSTPVLVRLHSGNFRFSSAKEDGSDLRFVAGDDKTPLKHHVEKYDGLLGEALIWVAVPNLQAGAKTDLWLYYGNKKAVAIADAKGTYDPDTLLVYHFSERGTPSLDSSVWANNAQSVGQPAEGSLIGTGLRLDGHNPLTIPAASSLAVTGDSAWTYSVWIKPAGPQSNAALYSRRDGANGFVIGVDNGVPFVEVTNAGAAQRTGAAAPMPVGGWHHIAVVAAPGLVTLYLDGAAYGSVAASVPALNTTALVGGDSAAPSPAAAPAASPQPDASAAAPADGSATPAPTPSPDAAATPTPTPAPAPVAANVGFIGDVDELQISKIARPAGFIKFAAVDQGPDPSKLVAFSVDEETASWLSGYFAVILKSVTIDGWVVIGVLLIMAALSWVVMIDRASYLNKQARANARFMTCFRELDLTFIDSCEDEEVATLDGRLANGDARMMRSSSLYRIYHIGAAEIRRRLAHRRPGVPALSAASIAAIRASLDSGVVKEMQRLNRLMVILTIAISGGPFLGLLGTVVGVMITFAAIAASGDVNVNAIAPGIAAALVATVAGLGVAIPALFGYNYLISRIKDLTSDIQVFVDELVTRMAELYSADRPDPFGQQIAAE